MRETGSPLAERSMRDAGSPLADRSMRSVDAPRTPGPVIPPRAVVKTAAAFSSIPRPQMTGVPPKTSPAKVSPPKVPSNAAGATPTPPKASNYTPPKAATPAPSNTPLKSSKSSTPPKSGAASKNGSPLNPAATPPSKLSTPLQSGISNKSSTLLKSSPAASKPGSEKSLGAPSSYRNVFFGDKDGDSDSSVEDVEHAVIKHAVKRSSSETPVKGATPVSAGKPRLVAFTHERTPASAGQGPRRDVSQRVVLQGGEDSDPEAEMRIGLEYVRQLGHPESNHNVTRPHASASTSRLSSASDPPRTPSAEFYASNNSNNSIAGRTRVLAPLVISSHRNRHQAAYSMASTHDSFVSLMEREGAGSGQRDSQWMVDTTPIPIKLYASEPFNFAAPLHRAQDKHTSALAGSALEAKQADGKSLPEWLRFDKAQREFWGVPPKARNDGKEGALVTRVMVKIWEAEKGEVVGECVIEVVSPEEWRASSDA
jgi:hypothetical protein